jgi:hypothetical protein
MSLSKLFNPFLLTLSVLAFVGFNLAQAAPPVTRNGVTTIHLEQHNGYFAARETLAGLKPGVYDFVVSNQAGKPAGFQLQDAKSLETLDMFPLEPGATRTSRVTISDSGFRYRCPINPTPWYEVNVEK